MVVKAIVVMHEADNVGNAIEDISGGDRVAYVVHDVRHELVASGDTPFGFKIALRDIPANGPIVKYKETIGLASRPIACGECVHIHNVEGNRGRGDLDGDNA